ncbi:hypothetical protein [Streptomyces sp. TRM68367]|uniref:hypothetical protein n=1 Tax=Streptomyces sp. TRM68367 TaxID=2758415 RepID=UPI00165C3FF9|nr:hypothetical protein [Streptomyces sp. TRM68367]MBC9728076.1 hypothetical protein [Streptomyces sp. TRM68367]
MNRTSKALAAVRAVNPFAAVERLLTLVSLGLVAATVGGHLGPLMGLHGPAGTVVGWSAALVFDALWIGALKLSETAIRQRSTRGTVVMLAVSVAAVAVSTGTLLVLGHAAVYAFTPVVALVFMVLRLFAENVLADAETTALIAAQSAADRNARALARARARHLRVDIETGVITETAEHLALMRRDIVRAEVLTEADAQVAKARAKAQKRLTDADQKHGQAARLYLDRGLSAEPSRAAVTGGAVTAHAEVVTQVTASSALPCAPVVTVDDGGPEPVDGGPQTAGHEADDLADETDAHDAEAARDPAPIDNPMTLEELAAVAGVDVPEPGITLTDEQITVVLRWLRYDMEPPRSFNQAREAYRKAGFKGAENRIRPLWALIEAAEAELSAAGTED